MHSAFHRTLLAACATGVALTSGAAHAQTSPRPAPAIAEIVSANGDEDAQLVELSDWIPAVVEQDLVPGDVLRTGHYGALGIAFEDRTQIRLHADSRMHVRGPDESGDTTRLGLDVGRAWARAGGPEREIEIETPAATAAIRGTDWFLFVAIDGLTRLIVLEGYVDFFNQYGRLRVLAGESATARPGAAPQREAPTHQPDRPRWASPLDLEWIHLITFENPYAPTEPVGAARDEAERLLDQGDYVGARGAGRAAADSSRSRLIDAMAAAQAGHIEEAAARLAEARPALSGRRAFVADLLDIGLAVERGEFARANADLEALESAYPGQPEPLLLRAWLEAFAARYDQARIAYDRAVEGRPAWSRAQALRAQLAYLEGDDAAFADATEAGLAADPSDHLAWRWRGRYLLTVGANGPSAAEAFARATEANPSSWRDRASLGSVESALGDHDAAIAALEDAAAVAPDRADTYAAQVFPYAAIDRLNRAADEAARAAALAPTDPDVLAANALVALMQGDPAAASRDADAAVAGDPGRTGAASLVAVTRWAAGERGPASEAIETAMRLDPNDANSALIGSVMAQNRAEAGASIGYARRSWAAQEHGPAAGFAEPPASQAGDIDIGAAFTGVGLDAWGEHYGHLAHRPFRANSAFFLSTIYPSEFASSSAVTQGLLLDPLAVSFPVRWAEFFRAPRHDFRAGASAEAGEGPSGHGVFLEAQGFDRAPHPFAYAAVLEWDARDGGIDNTDSEHGLINLRFGREVARRHGMFARLTGEWHERELPGDAFHRDFDDEETLGELVADAGYAFRRRHNDQFFVRAAGATSRRTFDNPSAFGHGLDSISYSLASTFGVEDARVLVSDGLFDTGLGTLDDPILILEPPPMAIVVGPAGDAVFDDIDEDDEVLSEEARVTRASLQVRRLVEHGRLTLSYGAEAGVTDARTTTIFFEPHFLGDIAVIDVPSAVVFFIDHDEALDFESRSDTETTTLEAHVFGSWRANDAAIIEAGLFARRIDSETTFAGLAPPISDEDVVLDPRIGAAFRFGRARLRLAAQRDRMLSGLDTIAPIGVVGLPATRSLGVIAEEMDDYRVRLEFEASERLFLFVEGEHQEITGAHAPLPGRRIGVAAYEAGEADLTTVLAGADLFFAERWALALRGRRTWTEIGGAGFAAGSDLPFVPEHIASARLTYTHPAQIRASVSVEHLGARFTDDSNFDALASATIVAAGIEWSPDERRWAIAAEAENILDEAVEILPGVFQGGPTVRVSVVRRF